MATLYRTDGSAVPVSPKNGEFTAEEIHQLLGDYFEIVPSTEEGHILLVAENGKLNGLHLNIQATNLSLYGWADPIAGDAILCPDTEIS